MDHLRFSLCLYTVVVVFVTDNYMIYFIFCLYEYLLLIHYLAANLQILKYFKGVESY